MSPLVGMIFVCSEAQTMELSKLLLVFLLGLISILILIKNKFY